MSPSVSSLRQCTLAARHQVLQAGVGCATEMTALLLDEPLVEVSGVGQGVIDCPKEKAEFGLRHFPQVSPADGSLEGAFPSGPPSLAPL